MPPPTAICPNGLASGYEPLTDPDPATWSCHA
jgi:hypothetical protein